MRALSSVVHARVIAAADARTLHRFIQKNAHPTATVYTDEAKAYLNLPFDHASVNHSAGEYVSGDTHTNGIESFWSKVKRAYTGTYHKMSAKHLNRYMDEFSGRLGLRDLSPWGQLEAVAVAMNGKTLPYAVLVKDNARPSGAHPCEPKPKKPRGPLVLRAIHYRKGEKEFTLGG